MEIIEHTVKRPFKFNCCELINFCIPSCGRKLSKYSRLVNKGNDLVGDALDLKALLQTQRTVKILEKMLLGSK